MGFAVRHQSSNMFASFDRDSTPNNQKLLQCFQDKSKSSKTVIQLLSLSNNGCPTLFESGGGQNTVAECRHSEFFDATVSLRVGQMFDSKRKLVTLSEINP